MDELIVLDVVATLGILVEGIEDVEVTTLGGLFGKFGCNCS